MTQLPVIIGVVLAIALVLGFAVLAIRRGAKAEERAKQQEARADAADRVTDAISKAPATIEELSTRVQRGDWKLALPFALLLLAGCAGPVAGSCQSLVVREYTDAEAAVITSQAVRAPPELGSFVVEASRLRAAVRACAGKQ